MSRRADTSGSGSRNRGDKTPNTNRVTTQQYSNPSASHTTAHWNSAAISFSDHEAATNHAAQISAAQLTARKQASNMSMLHHTHHTPHQQFHPQLQQHRHNFNQQASGLQHQDDFGLESLASTSAIARTESSITRTVSTPVSSSLANLPQSHLNEPTAVQRLRRAANRAVRGDDGSMEEGLMHTKQTSGHFVADSNSSSISSSLPHSQAATTLPRRSVSYRESNQSLPRRQHHSSPALTSSYPYSHWHNSAVTDVGIFPSDSRAVSMIDAANYPYHPATFPPRTTALEMLHNATAPSGMPAPYPAVPTSTAVHPYFQAYTTPYQTQAYPYYPQTMHPYGHDHAPVAPFAADYVQEDGGTSVSDMRMRIVQQSYPPYPTIPSYSASPSPASLVYSRSGAISSSVAAPPSSSSSTHSNHLLQAVGMHPRLAPMDPFIHPYSAPPSTAVSASGSVAVSDDTDDMVSLDGALPSSTQITLSHVSGAAVPSTFARRSPPTPQTRPVNTSRSTPLTYLHTRTQSGMSLSDSAPQSAEHSTVVSPRMPPFGPQPPNATLTRKPPSASSIDTLSLGSSAVSTSTATASLPGSDLSRVCVSCRASNLHCDGTRPSCTKCVQSQIRCDYPQRRRGPTAGEAKQLRERLTHLNSQLQQLRDPKDSTDNTDKSVDDTDTLPTNKPKSPKELADGTQQHQPHTAGRKRKLLAASKESDELFPNDAKAAQHNEFKLTIGLSADTIALLSLQQSTKPTSTTSSSQPALPSTMNMAAIHSAHSQFCSAFATVSPLIRSLFSSLTASTITSSQFESSSSSSFSVSAVSIVEQMESSDFLSKACLEIFSRIGAGVAECNEIVQEYTFNVQDWEKITAQACKLLLGACVTCKRDERQQLQQLLRKIAVNCLQQFDPPNSQTNKLTFALAPESSLSTSSSSASLSPSSLSSPISSASALSCSAVSSSQPSPVVVVLIFFTLAMLPFSDVLQSVNAADNATPEASVAQHSKDTPQPNTNEKAEKSVSDTSASASAIVATPAWLPLARQSLLYLHWCRMWLHACYTSKLLLSRTDSGSVEDSTEAETSRGAKALSAKKQKLQAEAEERVENPKEASMHENMELAECAVDRKSLGISSSSEQQETSTLDVLKHIDFARYVQCLEEFIRLLVAVPTTTVRAVPSPILLTQFSSKHLRDLRDYYLKGLAAQSLTAKRSHAQQSSTDSGVTTEVSLSSASSSSLSSVPSPSSRGSLSSSESISSSLHVDSCFLPNVMHSTQS